MEPAKKSSAQRQTHSRDAFAVPANARHLLKFSLLRVASGDAQIENWSHALKEASEAAANQVKFP